MSEQGGGDYGDGRVAAVGAELVSIKILRTHPDVVQLVLEAPGTFRETALKLGNFVGWYFEAIAFMKPKAPNG